MTANRWVRSGFAGDGLAVGVAGQDDGTVDAVEHPADALPSLRADHSDLELALMHSEPPDGLT